MILKSSTRSWLILIGLVLLFMGMGHLIAGRQGTLWGVIVAVCLNLYIYFYVDETISQVFDSRLIEGQDPWGLTNLANQLATRARVPLPTIHVVKSPSIQALVAGRNPHHGHILLTEGLLSHLSKDELKGVLAYQMASLKLLDTLGFLVSYSLTGMLIKVTQFLDSLFRAITGARADRDSIQSRLFTTLFAPMTSWILKLNLNHKVYFDIDALAATYLSKPRVLAEALWKMDSYASTVPLKTPVALGNMFIVSPLAKQGWSRHFHIQPSTEKRIKRLIGYYPI